jgi:phosphate:Na+ symporter
MPEPAGAPELAHNIWLLLWAGLGMLFVGVRLISVNVQRIAAGRLRELIARTLERPGAPQALGFVSGLITQSSAAVTFAATGLVSAGAATLVTALPLIPWANVGTVALAMMAGFDLLLAVYAAFGVLGLLAVSRRQHRETAAYLLFATLGLALVLFGMSLLREAALAMRDDPTLTAALTRAGSTPWLALLVGGVLGAAAQSALIVSVVAVPLVQSGLIGLEGYLLIVYGASVGTGIGQYLNSSGMASTPRQLLVGGVLIRTASSALLVVAFVAEHWMGVPLLAAALRGATPNEALQCGIGYLVVQLMLAIVCQVLRVPIAAQARRLVPVVVDPVPASMRTAFVFDAAAQDADLALTLAGQEFARLVGLLPGYLDDLRDPAERPADALPVDRRHAGSTAIAQRIDGFLARTLEAGPDSGSVRRVFALRGQVDACRMLQTTLHAFATEVAVVPPGVRPPLAHGLVEGLHAILGAAGDAWAAGADDPHGAELLRELVAPRGALMDTVRSALLEGAQGFRGRESLLSATLHFEMCLWVLQRLVPLARSSPATPPASASAAG